jgi:hypothetical protein
MRYPELPEGVAAYYVVGGEFETVCILAKSDGKKNNALPSSKDHFEPLAVGVAFFSEKDRLGDYDTEKGMVIALGRALKMYNKTNSVGAPTLAGFVLKWS